MPIIKSAKKQMRQNAKHKQRNFRVRRNLHDTIRDLNDTIADGNKAEAQKKLSIAYKTIDTAVKKNILHKNNGNRKKSSLAHAVDKTTKKVETTTKQAPAKKVATKKVEKAEVKE